MKIAVRSVRGAVLVVSLIMLLLLTLLGFAAMNTSVLEVLMSFNTVRQTQSLATAENVLRIAESDLEDLVAPPATANLAAYYYNHASDGTEPLETDLRDWSGFNSNVVPDPDDESISLGRYIIEYIGEREIYGCSASEDSVGSSGCMVHAHIVTARSADSGSRSSMRLVQSIYLTESGPDE